MSHDISKTISEEQESIHSAELRLNLQIALDPELKRSSRELCDRRTIKSFFDPQPARVAE
jgi:hypothetical protein